MHIATRCSATLSRVITRRWILPIALVTVACSTGRVPSGEDDSPKRTTIEIQNQEFNDMTVYVLVNSQRTRLGIAPGNKTTVLTIPAYLILGTSVMRFVCEPLAGNTTPVTEQIDVSPGDQLVMIVNPGG
jgi:hypothetical protein